MLRTPLALNYLKRTIRPLYANTQATPQAMFLDPAWDSSVDIYPGMALMRTTGMNVSLLGTAAGASPFGLSDFFEAPKLGIKQISDSGINACAVWLMGPDAQFVVLAPAFDTAQSYADPAAGTAATLICAYTAGPLRGTLHPSGITGTGGNTAGTSPIARLVGATSNSITIAGLQARTS